MEIVQIASEMAPVAKVGGLADVILGLSRELIAQGHDVTLILPKYDTLELEEIKKLKAIDSKFLSYYDGQWIRNTIWSGQISGVQTFFIEAHNIKPYFSRGAFYGEVDDIERFTYFSRAALEFLLKAKRNPEVIHIHEWQTALVAPLYYDMYSALGLNRAKLVFTMHNLGYQGLCEPIDLDRIGLKGKDYLFPDKLQDSRSPKNLNLLKGAIVYSNAITTVSPSYAQEILRSDAGQGLDGTLRLYKDKLRGILNGLDYSYWNPATDPYLVAKYSARSPAKKKLNKEALRTRFRMSQEERPLVGCVSRLVPQKGIDLIKHAIFRTLEKGGQFILLGSSPILEIDAEFQRLKMELAGNPHVHLLLHHREDIAHQIYAGADMFIVPSLFEPCGLTQIIALRYGTVPIVRHTGGLIDTVFDVDYSDKPLKERNGFSFDHPDRSGVNSALDRALACWYSDPARWQNIIHQGMSIDHSWTLPCERYLEVYRGEG